MASICFFTIFSFLYIMFLKTASLLKFIKMRKSFIITAVLISLIAGSCVSNTEQVMETKEDHSKIIAAWISIQPEHIDEFIVLFSELTELTLQEPGCTEYKLMQDPSDPGSFLVFETYVNQAAVDAHFAAPYFTEYGEKIGALTSKPAEIVVYDVAGETRP
jgi:quinol monooxygenase YgiN